MRRLSLVLPLILGWVVPLVIGDPIPARAPPALPPRPGSNTTRTVLNKPSGSPPHNPSPSDDRQRSLTEKEAPTSPPIPPRPKTRRPPRPPPPNFGNPSSVPIPLPRSVPIPPPRKRKNAGDNQRQSDGNMGSRPLSPQDTIKKERKLFVHKLKKPSKIFNKIRMPTFKKSRKKSDKIENNASDTTNHAFGQIGNNASDTTNDHAFGQYDVNVEPGVNTGYVYSGDETQGTFKLLED